MLLASVRSQLGGHEAGSKLQIRKGKSVIRQPVEMWWS